MTKYLRILTVISHTYNERRKSLGDTVYDPVLIIAVPIPGTVSCSSSERIVTV